MYTYALEGVYILNFQSAIMYRRRFQVLYIENKAVCCIIVLEPT